MTFDVVSAGGKTTLWLESERIEACVQHARSQGVDSIGINAVRGYRPSDVEFLENYPWIEALEIVFPAAGAYDVAPLRCLKQLRALTLSAPVPLTLEQFPHLDSFRGVWHPDLRLSGCDRLRTLNIADYRPRSHDLAQLELLPELVDLGLVDANVRTLRGVERFPKLERLELVRMLRLASLDGIQTLPALETLDCHTCKAIVNKEDVVRCTSLRSLRYNNCGRLPNLGFLRDMPTLEEFRFVNTLVEDGDLRPLERLKFVGFLPKKNYSHTPEELDAILRRRGGSAVPRIP